MIRSGSLCSSQYSTSRFTHLDRAASGDSNTMNHSESFKASVIDSHKCGFAASDASSRKIRNALRFHHGLAKR